MKTKELLEDVIKIVKKAGEETLVYYNGEFNVKDKGDDSPVTEADISSNNIILKNLLRYDYGIISEEEKDNIERFTKTRVWVIDPLDGTKDFINKTDEFSIIIGLVEKNEDGKYRPILGLVYMPATNVLYYALKGEGSFVQKNGEEKRLFVSADNSQIKMIGSRFHESELELSLMKKLGVLEKITCGSVGVKIGKIAEGVANFNMNPSNKTSEWDVCAPDIILKEAGGIFTDLAGNEFTYNKKELRNNFGYLAASKGVYNKILQNLPK